MPTRKDDEKYDQAVESFEATGKVWFTEDEKLVQKFRDVVFPEGRLNKDVVGRSCKCSVLNLPNAGRKRPTWNFIPRGDSMKGSFFTLTYPSSTSAVNFPGDSDSSDKIKTPSA